MSEQSKTLSFVATAGVTLLLAIVTYFQTQPKKSTGFENVGQEFFADFQGSEQAASLEVRAVDNESATLKEFRVEEDDGLWTIPSHYGYPAEATERLAETSSSLIGLKREALVGRLATEHERFGVLDPLDDDNVDPESTGKRITIKDDSDEVLVDLIIGKEAEDSQPTDMQQAMARGTEPKSYYVRHPDEQQTFKVKMDLELSTRFSDWINPDLLDLESADVRKIDINNYELIEQTDPLGRFKELFKKQGDQMEFTRDTGFGPWTMAGLDTETKDLDSTKINNALRTLDNLRIAGVRKKMTYQDQQLLTADLKVVENEALTANPQLFNQVMGQMQQELADYGFNLTRDPKTQETICVAEAGDIAVGRENGVLYTMQFGKAVSGDEDEIEIGISNSTADQTNNTESEDAGMDDPAAADAGTDSAAEGESEEIKNRYLMIRVSFEESLLGDKPEAPVAPVEPAKPEGYVAAAQENSNGESEAGDDAPKPEGAENNEQSPASDDDENAEPVDDRPQEFKDYDLGIATYKQQKTEYELKLSQFEDQKKEFEQKISDGNKLVGELNERFGRWFYVISGDNLESIQMKKDELVSEKPNPEGEDAEEGLPERPNINFEQDVPDNSGDNSVPETDPVNDAETSSQESLTNEDGQSDSEVEKPKSDESSQSAQDSEADSSDGENSDDGSSSEGDSGDEG